MYLSVFVPLAAIPLALATKYSVKVGGTALKFNPETVSATKGDTIEFDFYPSNHSVAESTFEKPCQAKDGGIFSGFIPGSSGKAKQIFTVTLNDTDPHWLYCSQEIHCQQGMVFVINPPKSGNTIKDYTDGASKAQGTSSQPAVAGGEVSDGDASNSSSSSSSASSSTKATATASSASSASSAATPSASKKPNAAVKAGAGTGLGALGLLGVLVGGMV